MAINRSISIIGHFGGNEIILDGQTIKTKILYQELINATQWHIQVVDTYFKRKNPIKLIWQTVKCLLTTKDVIVLLSGNGMRFYFPLLSFCAQVFGTRIYHDVIGGNLDKYVKKYPAFRKYLNSFQANWVETWILKQRLEMLGIANVQIIPNFKRLRVVTEEKLHTQYSAPFKFCTFSRVMREKGIEDAIDAIETINREFGKTLCTLDIYGKVDADYTNRFGDIMKRVTPAVKYCGMVPFDKSAEIIKDYYGLLFPTYWDGEGFAGTVIDAYAAGVPVIATDWGSNGEIVENLKTGIIYPNNQIDSLKGAILWAIQNLDMMEAMKKNCIHKAQNYQPKEHICNIIKQIDRN